MDSNTSSHDAMQMLDTAIEYAKRGFHLLPLALTGEKHAGSVLGANWQLKTSCDTDVVTKWFAEANYNLGIHLGPISGVVDIEADSPEGNAKADELLGHIVTPTWTSSRSTHRLLLWDERLAPLKKTVYKIDGIEFRVGRNDDDGNPMGCQSLVPPSTGRQWVEGRSLLDCEPATLPQFVVDMILEANAPKVSHSGDMAVVVPHVHDDRVADRARAYLEKVPPAISGQRGHDATFKVASKLVRGFGLSDDAAYVLLSEWNQRCEPPWSEPELRRKICEAREKGSEEFGSMLVANDSRNGTFHGHQQSGMSNVLQPPRDIVFCSSVDLAMRIKTNPDIPLETMVITHPIPAHHIPNLRGIRRAVVLEVAEVPDENLFGQPMGTSAEHDGPEPNEVCISGPQIGDKTEDVHKSLKTLFQVTRELCHVEVDLDDDDDAVSLKVLVAKKWWPKSSLLPQHPAPRAHFIGELLRSEEKYYTRGGGVVLHTQDGLREVTAHSLPYELSAVGLPDMLKDTEHRQILASRGLHERMPAIRAIAPCPLLVADNGQLVMVTGYHEPSGILATGSPPPVVPLSDAVTMLIGLLDDFHFATPSDKTRALAAMICPALILSGLLDGRAPIDLGEANQSQSGKGWRNKITNGIYGCQAATITAKVGTGGVGSLDEAFSAAILAGRSFVAIDNVRGKIDSPLIESYMTESSAQLRVPYRAPIEVETGRVVLMMTSNKAESTIDLANRSAVVRIRKQPPDYKFRKFPEGDILDHISANQPRYLGAVFAIIRAWWDAGRPTDPETRHDFRRWAGVMSWITRELMGCDADLLDGHRQAQVRMASPDMNWLRDVAQVVAKSGRVNEWLRAHHLVRILDDAGEEIPGVKNGDDLETESVFRQACQQVGRKLSRLSPDVSPDAPLSADEWQIERREKVCEQSRTVKEYYFSRLSPDNPPDVPLMVPLINPRVSPDSPDGSELNLFSEQEEKGDGVPEKGCKLSGDQGESGEIGSPEEGFECTF